MGKAINLFLVNGKADSLTIGGIINWSGNAIKVPRIEVKDCNEEELSKSGVYFLFCKTDDNEDAVYIGESDNVKDRLLRHIKDYDNEIEEYFWTTAIAFTGRDLNKTRIIYLEKELVQITKNCNRYTVLTKHTYNNTNLNKAEKDAMDEFIENIKLLIGALGYKVLEPLVPQDENQAEIDDKKLYLNTQKIAAVGLMTTEGFVVCKGSKIVEENYDSCTFKSIINLRDQYRTKKAGKIINNILQEDTLFSSSSAAAAFVLGRNASGPTSWKNKDGLSLKELEASQNSSIQV